MSDGQAFCLRCRPGPGRAFGERWDWNLAGEYAQKLTKKGAPPRWGFAALNSVETGWYNYVVANGGAMFDEARARCTINSPQAQQATQFLVDMVQKTQWSAGRQELADAGGWSRRCRTARSPSPPTGTGTSSPWPTPASP